jgi:hypothetical protein
MTFSVRPLLSRLVSQNSSIMSQNSSIMSLTGQKRWFAVEKDELKCPCGAQVPSINAITKAIRERTLIQMANTISCPSLKGHAFKEPIRCQLAFKIKRVAPRIIAKFTDVVHIAPNRHSVLLESLRIAPQGEHGDLTGDYGKQLSEFVAACIRKKAILNVGSVLDIGGQNNATVKLVAQACGKPQLPSIVVDINTTTPALSPLESNIKYVVSDALAFFSFSQI